MPRSSATKMRAVAAFRCLHCSRRVRSAPYLNLRSRASRQEVRYHNAAPCLESGVLEAERLGPGRVVAGFYHARGCDPADRTACRAGCFREDEWAARLVGGGGPSADG